MWIQAELNQLIGRREQLLKELEDTENRIQDLNEQQQKISLNLLSILKRGEEVSKVFNSIEQNVAFSYKEDLVDNIISIGAFIKYDDTRFTVSLEREIPSDKISLDNEGRPQLNTEFENWFKIIKRNMINELASKIVYYKHRP